MAHSPALPAAGQPVVVTARLHAPFGVRYAYAYYRVDPSPNLAAVSLRDQGTAGHAVARDGIYSAIIPGQAGGALVAGRDA